MVSRHDHLVSTHMTHVYTLTHRQLGWKQVVKSLRVLLSDSMVLVVVAALKAIGASYSHAAYSHASYSHAAYSHTPLPRLPSRPFSLASLSICHSVGWSEMACAHTRNLLTLVACTHISCPHSLASRG